MTVITPFLWFDTQAEEAMNLYVSLFPDSRVLSVSKAGGKVFVVEFELRGQKFIGLNGGPMYNFNEAFSMHVSVETQAEVDEYWDRLTADGGEPGQCGWLKDKFGLSWQIVPAALPRLMSTGGATVMTAMRAMKKLDIAALERAALGN